jgi:predicted metal-dependent phosphoesterase TrpH
MHLHTVRGASDSMLDPAVLVQEMDRVSLPAVNVTEHDRLWDRFELKRFREEHSGLFINNGMEVSTDLGHIGAVGLDDYYPGMRRAEELRRILNDLGGYMIVNHPFRHFFDPVHFMRQGKPPFSLTPEQAAELPVFQLVDAIEVLNGCNTPRENEFALRVARALGKPGVGGSDAHSQQGIGYFATAFTCEITDEAAFLRELHLGRFHPVMGLPEGAVKEFNETALSEPSGPVQ